MIFKWTPNEELSEFFEGTITIDIPSRKERFDMIKRLELNQFNEQNISESEQLEYAEKLTDEVYKRVKKVQVTVKKFEIKTTSLEDLESFFESQLILNDLALLIIQGVRLGNDLSNPSKAS